MNNSSTRKPLRLKGFNYSSSGFYFITICINKKINLFGSIEKEKHILNDAGKMVERWWLQIPKRFSEIALDEYIVMPNHFHGIIIIVGADQCVGPDNPDQCVGPDNPDQCVGPDDGDLQETGEHTGSPLRSQRRQQTLFRIIQWYKTMTTNDYIHNVYSNHWQKFYMQLWQRGYYDHIVRNEQSLNNIRTYIKNNYLAWDKDEENPLKKPAA